MTTTTKTGPTSMSAPSCATTTSTRPAAARGSGWVLGYTRVSTLEQAAEGQEDALRAAGADRVWSDVASGAKAAAQRPGLAGLLEHARAGDVVLVTRLDRLGRSLPDLVALLAELEARQVTVRSLGDGVDTSTAAGRMVAGLWAVLAEAERAWIRERTLAGLAAARARGRVGGRPPGLSGDRLAAARDLHAAGRSLGQIARALGVGTSTVRRHLQAAGIDTGSPGTSARLSNHALEIPGC